MLRPFIPCIVVFTALSGLPVVEAQPLPGKGLFRLLSAYREDPIVDTSAIARINAAEIGYLEDGRRVLRGLQVRIFDEPKVYRLDAETKKFVPFAWNPWPEPTANPEGEFTFPEEERFPLFKTERGPDGKTIVRDGLQLWAKVDLHLGMNTAVAAALAVKSASERWAGRSIPWGDFGTLEINAHSFINFNGFYSPSSRSLFLGVVPYRLPGETDIRMFETASSWELAAHESGHAVHHTLKANADTGDPGFRTWGESFGDQAAMWTALRDPDRVQKLLAETQGDLNCSNSLTRLVEIFGFLTGTDRPTRDAFHDKKVSDTGEEVHDRSEVFTGAAYKTFVAIYNSLKEEAGTEQALQTAGQIMGVFLMRASDFTPENKFTLEDVGKAWLKVDQEFFQGRYHALLVNEFLRREIFQAGSEGDWLAHEADLPGLHVPRSWPDKRIEAYILARQSDLGIGPEFGLQVQSITRTSDSGMSAALEQTIVRVQLTEGSGPGATPMENHGILVFRADGTLADYYSPLPGDSNRVARDYFAQVQAMAAIGKAKQARMTRLGVPLALVRLPDGHITVEARVMRGEGLNAYMEVFTSGNPRGERREILISPLPPNKQLRVSDDLLR